MITKNNYLQDASRLANLVAVGLAADIKFAEGFTHTKFEQGHRFAL